MGVIRYGRTAQIGVYPGNQSGRYISYRSGKGVDPDTALLWDFLKSPSLESRFEDLSCVCASNRTYRKPNGLLGYVGPNEPRFDYGLNGESLGLIVESKKINYCEFGEDFENWSTVGDATVTPNTHIGPDGILLADTIATNAPGFFGVSRNHGATPNQPHVASFFIRKETGPLDMYPGASMQFQGVDANAPYQITIDPINGLAQSRDIALPAEKIEVIDWGDYWRVMWGATSTNHTTTQMRFFPAVAPTYSPTWSADDVGAMIIWGANLTTGTDGFRGGVLNHYIPNPTSGSVTKEGEVIQTANASWYDETAQTLIVEGKPFLRVTGAIDASYLFKLGDDERDQMYLRAESNLRTGWRSERDNTANPTKVNAGPFDIGENVNHRWAWSQDANFCEMYSEGLPATGIVPPVQPPLPTVGPLFMGHRGGSAFNEQWDGHIKYFQWINALKDSQWLIDNSFRQGGA